MPKTLNLLATASRSAQYHFIKAKTPDMTLHVQTQIQAPPTVVWDIITDIEHADRHIGGIERIEILERPTTGLVGLKWRETRTMFGKTATETMWITAAEVPAYYQARAASHGMEYLTTLRVNKEDGHSVLSMEFTGRPRSLGARMMGFVLGPFIRNTTKKALEEDLADIKSAAESQVAA